VKIIVQHVEALHFRAAVEKHTVSMDAAPEDGGTGAAPSAPQLFVAAVGACILEFVANSCHLHDVPFERLSLQVEYAEQAQPRRVGVLEATLCIEPEPPADVKRRLVGVARHATLVNTLARPPEIVIRFAEDA
jgi:uncharacterized OsmC-like protein